MTKKIMGLFLATVLMVTMSNSAMAAEFTPSVEGKPAPEVVTQTGKDGKEYAAIIYDANGNEMVGVPAGNLTVTSVAGKDSASPEIQKKLDEAYEQLKSVNSLTELSDQLESVIKEISPDLTVEDLVVRDLFDVSVPSEYEEYLKKEGASLSVRFKLSAEAEALAAVLHNTEGTEWETVSNDRITRNKDLTADVVFYGLSPVAFLYDAGQLDVDPNAPDSPQTGEPDSYSMNWIAAAAAVFLATGIYVVAKKRSSQKS
ncbi:MAG: hypothetical protein EOM40_15740 [Clostridia bacterium]|nr:hypothetical protein [Clostridia bacterium]